MAIEVIPKKAEAEPFDLIKFLFYLSAILLIISVLAYLGLFFIQRDTKATFQKVEEEIKKVGTPEDKALEEKVLLYQRKLDDFSILINAHQSNLKFFTSLEGITHPKVFFSKTDLKVRGGQVSLSGITENFEVLGQQFLIFKNEDYIKNVNLSKVSISKEGKIEFTLEVSFSPEQFKY